MNMYGGAGFAVGLDAITAGFNEAIPRRSIGSPKEAMSPQAAISASASARSRRTIRMAAPASPSSPSGAATGRTSPGATSPND